MTDGLGIMGRLLEAAGRLSGQTFGLFPHNAPSSADEATSPPVTALAALEADAARADAPCARQTPDGRWLGGVAIPVAGQERLLFSCLRGDDGPSDSRQRDTLEVLQCVGKLLKEREASVAESRQLIEELNRTYEELHLFASITKQVRSLRYSDDMLRAFLQEARDAMRVELTAALFDTTEHSDVIVTGSASAGPASQLEAFLAKLSAEMPRSAPSFENGCFIVNCSSELPSFAALHPQPFRALAVSMRNGDRRCGQLLLVSFKMDEVFRRGEYRLLSTMAEQLALVMANTDLYRDLELFVISLVKSFVTAIEAKDPYTKGHSERVSQLCMRLGDAMGLDGKQLKDLQWASVLHDVGKIGTPEIILNKPDRLTDEEYDDIKTHPAKGDEILTPIAQLTDALPGIRHHHERYDGRGYPDGLAGDDIPLLARIIAVADTYDAVTSTRAYRPGRTHTDAMRILHECSGTQLDPRAVDMFVKVVEQEPPPATPGSRAPCGMQQPGE